MKAIVYVLTVMFIVSCQGSGDIPNDVEWVIVKEESNEAISKDKVEIRLNKKVDKSILEDIALVIREDRKQYDKLWIFYYIPTMTSGMAWATSHFTPDLEIQIIGSTEMQDLETSNVGGIDGDVLGKWRSEKSLMGAALILYQVPEGKKFIRIVFKNGSELDSEVEESLWEGRTKFSDDNEHGEFYVVESNGNLGLYGGDGKFDEAIRIE